MSPAALVDRYGTLIDTAADSGVFFLGVTSLPLRLTAWATRR